MRLLAVALALFLLPQDEKVTLKFAPRKGDKITKSEKLGMKFSCTVDAGGETQKIEFEQRGTEKTVTEYVEAADGKLSRIVVDHVEDFEESKQPPTMEWNRKDNPLHGRKVTVFMKDGRLVREGADGIEEKQLESLDLEYRDAVLFPKNPVAVGESWEVTGADLAKYLQDQQEIKEGKLKLKLAAVKEVDKRRCAIIQGTFDLKGRTDEGMDLTVNLEAEMVVWIERGYLLKLNGKGKVTIKGGNDQFTMSGDGPMTIDIEKKVD